MGKEVRYEISPTYKFIHQPVPISWKLRKMRESVVRLGPASNRRIGFDPQVPWGNLDGQVDAVYSVGLRAGEEH